MVTIRYGATSRLVTIKGDTLNRNDLTKQQDDKLIRLVKFLTFGETK